MVSIKASEMPFDIYSKMIFLFKTLSNVPQFLPLLSLTSHTTCFHYYSFCTKCYSLPGGVTYLDSGEIDAIREEQCQEMVLLSAVLWCRELEFCMLLAIQSGGIARVKTLWSAELVYLRGLSPLY